MAERPKVLVIDDEEDNHWLWHTSLDARVQLLDAYTPEQGENLYYQHPDVKIIAIDACVPGNKPTTLPLVQRLRQHFTGPMIAMASLAEHRRELVRAGCNFQIEKERLSSQIRELL